jgi:hypothetical protein
LELPPKGVKVDIFQFFWGALAWTVTVAVLWPLNIPMAALSFRIWRETKESDIEGSELWIRAALASGAVMIICLVFVAVDYVLADLAEFPPGIIHLVIFVGFLALACWVMAYIFSLEDFFQGLSLVIIYLFLPVIALFLLNSLLGLLSDRMRFWDPLLDLAKAWLKQPESSS